MLHIIINRSAELIVDTMNFYFETKTLSEINDTSFISLYADEAENLSKKNVFNVCNIFFLWHQRATYLIPGYC